MEKMEPYTPNPSNRRTLHLKPKAPNQEFVGRVVEETLHSDLTLCRCSWAENWRRWSDGSRRWCRWYLVLLPLPFTRHDCYYQLQLLLYFMTVTDVIFLMCGASVSGRERGERGREGGR